MGQVLQEMNAKAWTPWSMRMRQYAVNSVQRVSDIVEATGRGNVHRDGLPLFFGKWMLWQLIWSVAFAPVALLIKYMRG